MNACIKGYKVLRHKSPELDTAVFTTCHQDWLSGTMSKMADDSIMIYEENTMR